MKMLEGLGKDKIISVYNNVASRYDFQHGFLTLKSDQRGREMVVDKCVNEGDKVLDCGAGTGATSLLASNKTGAEGKVILFDLSEGMLSEAEKKFEVAGVYDRAEFINGDMLNLPFEDSSFDVVLSTYSECPLYDPSKGAMEMYRVIKPGGKIGIVHSTTPEIKLIKTIADLIEKIVWRFPSISLGCRAVDVLPAFENAGGEFVFKKRFGVPLWPFIVLVVEKPKI